MFTTEEALASSGGEAALLAERIAGRLASCTPSLVPLAPRLALAASYDVPVLLTGETGTGKTHLARLIHDLSPRSALPFVTVPCGALPDDLIEGAFFGHTQGAFTGADRSREGKFAAAGSGSIVLEEVDTLPLAHQAGLLRVIDTGEYEPVGSNQTRRCRARVLATSNWDLEGAVADGRFREDLYYRLGGLSFCLPPLRQRPEDVASLVRAFLVRYAARFGKGPAAISEEALAALAAFSWPGNIRQLDHVIQQAVLLSRSPVLLPHDLPEEVWHPRQAGPPREQVSSGLLEDEVGAAEQALIRAALERNDNNRTRAASDLGISRVTLYKKIKKYGVTAPPGRPGRLRRQCPADRGHPEGDTEPRGEGPSPSLFSRVMLQPALGSGIAEVRLFLIGANHDSTMCLVQAGHGVVSPAGGQEPDSRHLSAMRHGPPPRCGRPSSPRDSSPGEKPGSECCTSLQLVC